MKYTPFTGLRYPITLLTTPVAGDGIQAPGAVVLRDMGPRADCRFVVHFYNDQDGGYHNGSYFVSYQYAAAVREFCERSEHCTRHHARLAKETTHAHD